MTTPRIENNPNKERVRFEPPLWPTSANVQAELYRRLTDDLSLECWLEYTAPAKVIAYGRARTCRFDIVAAWQGDVVAIIECKSVDHPYRKDYRTAQLARYEEFGHPVVFVQGLDEIDEAVAAIRKLKFDAALRQVMRVPR